MFRIIPQTLHTFVLLIVSASVWSTYAEDSEIQVIALAGKRVQMDCTIAHNVENVEVQWKDWVYNEARQAKVIYENGLVSSDHPRKNVYKLTEKKDLIISNVSKEDAGEYFCQLGEQDVMYTLVVVGKPICNGPPTLMVGEEGEITCEMDYSGNKLPQIKWVTKGETELKGEDMTDLEKAKLAVKVQGAASRDQQIYKCEVSMPGVMEECSIKLNVPYPVEDVVISPKKDKYEAGEMINCTAMGNPAPEVKWEPAPEAGNSKSGAGWMSIQVLQEWIGESKDFKCIASNKVSAQTATAMAKTMFETIEPTPKEEPETEKDKTSGPEYKFSTQKPAGPGKEDPKAQTTGENKQMIGIVIGIIVVALALVIIIVAVVLFKRRKAAAKKPKGSKPVPTKEPNDLKDGKV